MTSNQYYHFYTITMFLRFFKPLPLPASANWGVLILRVGTSLLMLRYGFSKLDRYLGGNHGFADPFGLGEELTLLLTIFAELICSILLIAGFLTRAILIPLIITMLVALLIIHSDDPFDKKEHPIVFLIPYLTLWLTGPGLYSIDNKLFK